MTAQSTRSPGGAGELRAQAYAGKRPYLGAFSGGQRRRRLDAERDRSSPATTTDAEPMNGGAAAGTNSRAGDPASGRVRMMALPAPRHAEPGRQNGDLRHRHAAGMRATPLSPPVADSSSASASSTRHASDIVFLAYRSGIARSGGIHAVGGEVGI